MSTNVLNSIVNVIVSASALVVAALLSVSVISLIVL